MKENSSGNFREVLAYWFSNLVSEGKISSESVLLFQSLNVKWNLSLYHSPFYRKTIYRWVEDNWIYWRSRISQIKCLEGSSLPEQEVMLRSLLGAILTLQWLSAISTFFSNFLIFIYFWKRDRERDRERETERERKREYE